MDAYLTRLADVIVRYSTEVQPGEWVVLRGEPEGEPLLKALYAAVLAAGGQPSLHLNPGWANYLLLARGNDAQLEFIPPLQEVAQTRADVIINVLAERNTRLLSNIPPDRQQHREQATRPLFERFMERSASGALKWCVTLFPTNAYAQDADMSLDEYESFVYRAGLLDDPDPAARWQEISARQQRLVEWLKGCDQVGIRGADTDLRLSIKGRTFINASGKRNFPDGEIFTGPVEQSVEGWVRFTYPALISGREVTGIELFFEDGRVVKASATKNESALLSLLETDPGARHVGELGIGTNPGITRFTRNTLFDEKIQGTFHLALGASYLDTGGQNVSAIHEDLVCDLHDGEIIVDGDLLYQNGDFVV
ncbi:MAG TPA: aminopeptidase [Chloroflexi bacterium]|nr:aminopeptidase [Chloroflexota bacterium]